MFVGVFGHCLVGPVVADGTGETDEHPSFWVSVGWDGVLLLGLNIVVDRFGAEGSGGGVVDVVG